MAVAARLREHWWPASSTIQSRPLASRRDDVVTLLAGIWFVIGLFVDAWAHSNRPQLETFFTPWHAVFYSGFVATAGWVCWLVWRNILTGRRGIDAVPVGYGLTILALGVFLLSALADLIWHSVFGIEQSLAAVFSPSHLGLGASMLLILTSPLRSAWANPTMPAAPPLSRFLPAALSAGAAAGLFGLYLTFANAAGWSAESIVQAFSTIREGDGTTRTRAATLAGDIALTNAMLLAPMLLLARRWPIPPGTATAVYGVFGFLSCSVDAFEYPSTFAAIVLAGIAVDALVWWLRPSPGRRGRYWTFAALAALVTWSIYLAAASIAAGGLPDVVEYWTGMPVIAALHGLLLGVLFLPDTRHQPAAAH
ncbi:hypothetical protein ACTMTJ_21305 [Phytohabitans sp. LJ34]|uniref:hypothetical protein n=1 Tax=Phytohabitans sp. LJ34 TaxID=3452217 RepID=UPI003F896E36